MDYESGKYENKIKHPRKADFIKYYCYKAGKVIASGVSYEEAVKIKKQYNSCLIESVVDMEAYEKAYQEYRKGALEAEKRWRKDIEKEYGVSFDDKVIEIIFKKAWEEGHSNGLREVEHYFAEYLDLVKEILENASESEFIRKHLNLK